MKTKTCARCKKELPGNCFSINRQRKDGLQSYCKQCVSEIWKARKKKAILQHRIEQSPLSEFQSRELIIELRRRGYEGELRITQTIKV